MSNNQQPASIDPWISVVIIVRVIAILVLWIVLFLSIFMGYFTFPILLIGLVTVIYMISDLGIFVTLKRRQEAARQKQKAAETEPKASEEDGS